MDSFLFIGVDLPTDDLLQVIITKSFSDKQVKIDPKISNFIIKNTDRSYEKMFKILKDIDEYSLSSGKSINITLIKSILKIMNKYRTHNCKELNESHINKIVTLWDGFIVKETIENLLFVDLRDHYGITNALLRITINIFLFEKLRPESVLKVIGKVLKRSEDTQNLELETGKIEISMNP